MPEPVPVLSSESPTNGADLRVVVLGSGSSGNATVVSCGDSAVLIDVGFSARETVRRLECAGIEASSVTAIVVTHEHTDHISGVRVLAKRLGVPVYASAGTRQAGGLDETVADPRTLLAGEQARIGPFDVVAFRTEHDAAEPIGLRFVTPNGIAFGLATDTGHITPRIAEGLAGCAIVALEHNHDVDMLVNGPYPWFLKKRILSEHGHLSNDAAAEAIDLLAHDGLEAIVMMHLSRTNNEPDRASRASQAALDRLGHGARVWCSRPDTHCLIDRF